MLLMINIGNRNDMKDLQCKLISECSGFEVPAINEYKELLRRRIYIMNDNLEKYGLDELAVRCLLQGSCVLSVTFEPSDTLISGLCDIINLSKVCLVIIDISSWDDNGTDIKSILNTPRNTYNHQPFKEIPNIYKNRIVFGLDYSKGKINDILTSNNEFMRQFEGNQDLLHSVRSMKIAWKIESQEQSKSINKEKAYNVANMYLAGCRSEVYDYDEEVLYKLISYNENKFNGGK